MKKKLFALTLFSAVLITCEKKDDPEPTPSDTSAPVITLLGKSKDTVSLNSTYTDPGFTATDATDGTISGRVVVSGDLNTNQTGNYTRRYNVSDAAGNKAAEVTRMVHVKNDAAFLAGNYSAYTSCGATPSGNYNTTIGASQTVNNKISFSLISNNQTGQPVTASVNGTLITLDGLTGQGFGFSGSGSINPNKSITLSSYSSTGGSGSFCTSNLTKQ